MVIQRYLGFSKYTLGFPKIRGTFLVGPIIRIIVVWDVDWGPRNYISGQNKS